jgi:hypothetical protein
VSEQWWWLSFVKRDRFRGVAIVAGEQLADALRESRRRGINPGGQVAGWQIPADKLAEFPERYRNRLLLRDEVMGSGLGGRKLGDNPEAAAAAEMVCECCNGAIHKPH